MNVTGDAFTTPLRHLESASNFEVEKNVSLLKKANDQLTDQGMAMIEMLEKSSVLSDSGRLDVYA